MKIETFHYERAQGWSSTSLPPLDSNETVVLVFGASSFLDASEPIRELCEAYPNSHLIGCSTSGEIRGSTVADDTLSVAAMQFSNTVVRSASAPISSAEHSFGAGAQLARELEAADLYGVFVLSDGLQVNGSELVRGLNSVLRENVVVTGGLAGDGARFERTWVLSGGALQTGVVTAVGFYGDRIRIGHGSQGGWLIFGPERTVTRSKGNVLYELDGKPALQLYKQYLGEKASELPASALLFPLSLRPDPTQEKTIVRTILSIDEETQSMTFAGDVPQGARARLMQANLDRLIEGAEEAAHAVEAEAHGEPTLSIAISCVGRRLVLGERTDEELEAVLNELAGTTHQVGFYSYGEIAPFDKGHCDLHNQTMTVTTIRED